MNKGQSVKLAELVGHGFIEDEEENVLRLCFYFYCRLWACDD